MRAVNDQFLMRLIKVKSAMMTEGKLKANGVYRARDGYLIEDIVTQIRRQLGSAETALKNLKAIQLNMTFPRSKCNTMSDVTDNRRRQVDQNKSIDDTLTANVKASGKPIDGGKNFSQ